jgi:fermentation-respiration switch protein FrsA (DUF1100 family)
MIALSNRWEGAPMMFDRIFTYDFHGVKFADLGVELSARRLPSSDFYARLWDLAVPDRAFLNAKRETGAMIARLLANHGRPGEMLSWGAGTGTIEAEIAKTGWSVEAVEAGASAAWPKAINRYDDLDQVPETRKYDAVIEVSTLYSQSDEDVGRLLQRLMQRVKPGGLLLIAEQDTRSLLGSLRGLCARWLRHRPSRGAQFWGYLRGPSFYREAVAFEHVESHYFAVHATLSMQEVAKPQRIFDRQLLSRRSAAQFHLFRNPPDHTMNSSEPKVHWHGTSGSDPDTRERTANHGWAKL